MGNAGRFRCDLTNARVYYHTTRGCGRTSARHSLRPLFGGGRNYWHHPDESRRGNAEVCRAVNLSRITLRPHPEERAFARVSKDGRESECCIHPSRRGQGAAPQDEVGDSFTEWCLRASRSGEGETHRHSRDNTAHLVRMARS